MNHDGDCIHAAGIVMDAAAKLRAAVGLGSVESRKENADDADQ